MARDPSLLDLESNTPFRAIAPAQPAIAHVQLRDLLICPREKGLVNYVVNSGIVEQDMHAPGAPTRKLSKLGFTPISLTFLPVGVDDTLIAAGGQEREIHLSYYTPASSSSSSVPSTSTLPTTNSRSRRTRLVWDYEDNLAGSINNSVLLTSMSLTRSHESSVEPRLAISNNDNTVRMYDVPIRVQSSKRKPRVVGEIRLDVAVNHSSISPDGRMLLSVGDSNKIYFHQITGGARVSFAPIQTLSIPPPDFSPLSTALAAAFSTAFSADGSKFAVASQEGVVAVWDVRSTKAMRVWQTDKTRGMSGSTAGGLGSGGVGLLAGNGSWLDDPGEWTRGTKAPGWCARSVKFNSGSSGKEVMAFTEHTSLVHVVDARTFETHEIVRVPTLHRPPPPARRNPSETRNTVRERLLMRRGLPISNTRTGRTSPSSSSSGSPTQSTHGNAGTNTTPALSPTRTIASQSGPSSGSDTVRPDMMHFTHPTLTPSASNFPSPLRQSYLHPSSVQHRPQRWGLGDGAHTPGIVQTLGDGAASSPASNSETPWPDSPGARSPTGRLSRASSYSPPASIGDSTWRTLGGGGPVSRWGADSALNLVRAASVVRVGSDGTIIDGGAPSENSGGSRRMRRRRMEARLDEQEETVENADGGASYENSGGARRRRRRMEAEPWRLDEEEETVESARMDEDEVLYPQREPDRQQHEHGDQDRGPLFIRAAPPSPEIEREVQALVNGRPTNPDHDRTANTIVNVHATLIARARYSANDPSGGGSGERTTLGAIQRNTRPRIQGHPTYDERGYPITDAWGRRMNMVTLPDGMLLLIGAGLGLEGDPGPIPGAGARAGETGEREGDRMDVDADTQVDVGADAGGDDIVVDGEESSRFAEGFYPRHDPDFYTPPPVDPYMEPSVRFFDFPAADDDEEENEEEEDGADYQAEGLQGQDLDDEDEDEDDEEEEEEDCDSPAPNGWIRQGVVNSGAGTGSIFGGGTSWFGGGSSSTTTSGRYGSRSSPTASTATYSSGSGSTATIATTTSSQDKRRSMRTTDRTGSSKTGRAWGYFDDLDIAGICFDPSGERMYVAGVGFGVGGSSPTFPAPTPFDEDEGLVRYIVTPDDIAALGRSGVGGTGEALTRGYAPVGHAHHPHGVPVVGAIVEWGIRGAEKRWWVDDGWM